METVLAFYATHDEITNPGAHARRLDDLPEGLPGLHAAINGLLLHVWKARAWYGHLLTPPPRKVAIRHTEDLLKEVLRLDLAADLCGADGDLTGQRALYAVAPGLAPPETIRHLEGWPHEERPVRWREEP